MADIGSEIHKKWQEVTDVMGAFWTGKRKDLAESQVTPTIGSPEPPAAPQPQPPVDSTPETS